MTARTKGFEERPSAPRWRGPSAPEARIASYPAWKLEDAKARFSEVVRLARSAGPQRVTYRGADAVVVISVEDLAPLLPARRPASRLSEFLRSTGLGELELEREMDRGREIEL